MTARIKLDLISLLTALLVIAGFSNPGFAQNAFERLVMPGQLIQGHAKLEAECSKCHSPFSPKAQDDLCLACHKAIAADKAREPVVRLR